jgi:hypothetical protein
MERFRIEIYEVSFSPTRLIAIKSGFEFTHTKRSGERLKCALEVNRARVRTRRVQTQLRFRIRCNDLELQFALLRLLYCPGRDRVKFNSWQMDIGNAIYPAVDRTLAVTESFSPFRLNTREPSPRSANMFPKPLLKKSIVRGDGLYQEVSAGRWVNEPISQRLGRSSLGCQILVDTQVLSVHR